MKYLKILIRNASLNIPQDCRHYLVELRTIPFSTLRGCVYNILRERPISRLNPIFENKFKIKWIDEMVDGALYKIYDKNHLEDSFYNSGILKKEVFFKRKKEFTIDKNINVDSYLARNYKDFFTELKKIYNTKNNHEALILFKSDTIIFYKKEKLSSIKGNIEISSEVRQEIERATSRIEYLREKEKNSGQNWRLSDGYLKHFYTRYWLQSTDSYGNPHPLGVQGAPGYKFTFDADVILPILNKELEEKIVQKMAYGSKVVSFGDGGLAWPNIDKSFIFMDMTNIKDYLKINKGDIFDQTIGKQNEK